MAVYFWVDEDLHLQFVAKVGNGHSGGIVVRNGAAVVGSGNTELAVDLGLGANFLDATLIFTASIHKGAAEPPPPALLSVQAFQTDPTDPQAPPQNVQIFRTVDPPPFDANGQCVISLALGFA